jgi:hypothetical protein
MKIIRTKVMPMRVGRPAKIKATDEYGGTYEMQAGIGRPVTERDHITTAQVFKRRINAPPCAMVSAPLNGNREWIHIEQVNTWVS